METQIAENLRDRLQELRPPDSVLIPLLSGVGDCLMFTPALKLLRLAWPKTRLVALTMKESEFDILHPNPDLDEVLHWPFLDRGIKASIQYVLGLRPFHFDICILPCPSNRVQYNVIAALSGAKTRAGFRYLKQSRMNLDFLNQILLPHRLHVHNTEHNLELVEFLTRQPRNLMEGWTPETRLPTLQNDLESAQQYLEKHHIRGAPRIGLHLSSSLAKRMDRKCWPRENFLELLQDIRNQHPGTEFLLFCGHEDREISHWMSELYHGELHLVDSLPIRVVAELIRTCQLFISNDSGLLHVAGAMKTPSVAIFGPTNPLRSAPWMGRCQIVRRDLPCSPCFYHTSHELECVEGLNFTCLRELSVSEVLKSVNHQLASITS